MSEVAFHGETFEERERESTEVSCVLMIRSCPKAEGRIMMHCSLLSLVLELELVSHALYYSIHTLL